MHPDFFIVGAPKAGTTSLFDYLADHPLVIGTTPKETHFFADDLPGLQMRKFRDNYLSAFSAQKPTAQHGLDGSTNYLRSETAIANIRRYNPDARLIAILRHPVDTVYAFHSTLYFNQAENIGDFERAWRLQEARRAGNDIPRLCREPKQLQYRDYGMFSAQIERLLTHFPREQVRIYLFEDFTRDPAAVYADVMAFLGLPHDGRTAFDARNVNQRIRLRWLDALIMHGQAPAPVKAAVNAARGLSPSLSRRINNKLRRLNRAHNYVPMQRPPLRPE
ncbi:MAG: hypothetical protein CUN53_13000, partial [Phototrophicales bacterium]